MIDLLADRIKNASLTKTQRKIADYFLSNQERIGALSSMDVAREIGVSDASIIRFSRSIGYDGFADLKSHLYNMLVENAFAGLSLSERMKQSDEKFRERDAFPQFQNLMLQNLLATFSSNGMEDFDRAADFLLSARHRYVIGMRGCKGIAVSFSRILGFMLSSVTRLLDGECTSISALQDAGQGDVVLMFFFTVPRHFGLKTSPYPKRYGRSSGFTSPDPGSAAGSLSRAYAPGKAGAFAIFCYNGLGDGEGDESG